MRRLLPLAALLAAALAPPAAAQLDLPDKPRPTPAGKGAATGEQPEPAVPLPGTSRPKKQTATTPDRLSLPLPPPTGPGDPVAAAEAPADAARGGAPQPGAAGPSAAAAAGTPAEFVYAELRRLGASDPSLAAAAERTLVGLGAGALGASRAALRSEDHDTLLVAARVLLAVGTEADRQSVVERLRQPLPKRAAAPLLGALLEGAPELATTGLLVGLLDHGQIGVRTEAERVLRGRVGPELLPQLLAALRADRDDTRLRAVSLAAAVEDPAVLHLLVESLSDSSAKVAYRACQALAALQDERVEPALLGKAFGQPLILRTGAYALLALVLREERLGLVVLGDEHVPQLLDNLLVSQPLVAGACAAALAGIGFRSERPEETPWLDREVPHQLVRAVSAVEYHRDFTSLREPAERRLALISGRRLGSDGPAWQRWWVEEQPDFQARRAYLPVRPEDVDRIELHYRVAAEGEDFLLAGPAARGTGPAAGGAGSAGQEGGLDPRSLAEVFQLTSAECADLVALLSREGVFGAERLPGARGAFGVSGRRIAVHVGEQGKSFSFGEGVPVPWFDRVAEMALALRDRNRWQRYPDPVRHGDRRGLWEAERAWWSEERTALERDLRLKDLVLASLPAASYRARDEGVAELERLFELPGVPGPGDFAPLVALLRSEPFFGQRARRVAELAREAALLASVAPGDGGDVANRAGEGRDRLQDAGPDPGAAAARIDVTLGAELMEALLAAFGIDAAEELVLLLDTSEPELAQRAAADVRPFVRALAAAALARHPEDENLERLLALLDDDSEDVQAAAALALGEARVEEARTELLVRARLADPRVRAAALRAAGLLGGADARDALMLGLGDADPAIRLAAAQGLASLADPTTAEVLVSMLLRGSGSPLYAPAREGLLAIGEPAWSMLLRASSTGGTEMRREAALLLAEQGVALVASTLMTLLTEAPDDERVAFELAVLTGVDLRGEAEPAEAWWSWWDTVPHDDALGWLLRACEELGLETPARAALAGEGRRAGARFLLALLARPEEHMVERARRELSRRLGRDLGAVPPRGRAREGWLEGLGAWIERRWPE